MHFDTWLAMQRIRWQRELEDFHERMLVKLMKYQIKEDA